jgi:two-component system sensor histidine kinase UhpB
MKAKVAIEAEFAAILRDYIDGHDETALARAYELGRRALGAGIGVLDMAGLQIVTLGALAERGWPGPFLKQVEACQRCFLEALSVFEMTHRGFLEANAALRHFNDTLETEIKRIAHTLHGETGQVVAAINLEISELQRASNDGTRKGLQHVKQLLAQVEDQLRHLTHEIRPTVLDDLGLVPAIEFLRDGVEKRSPLRVRVEGPVTHRFPQAIEMTVYRIIQEALNNVLKHARAATVTIKVRPERQRLVCSIQDDGVGFEPAQPASPCRERGFGLMGMKERLNRVGGTLRIHSAPGLGTKLVVSIPLVH